MRRYLAPGFALLASVLLGFSAKYIDDSDMQLLTAAALGPVAYFASAYWWTKRAEEPAVRPWPHALMVWIPALPFIGLWFWLLPGYAKGDYDALAVVLLSPYALVATAISARGMLAVLREARRDQSAAPPTQDEPGGS